MEGFSVFSYNHQPAQKTDANVKTRREKNGQCADCGIQTHDIFKNAWGRQERIPLTRVYAMNGQSFSVVEGRCLSCNPMPGAGGAAAAGSTAAAATAATAAAGQQPQPSYLYSSCGSFDTPPSNPSFSAPPSSASFSVPPPSSASFSAPPPPPDAASSSSLFSMPPPVSPPQPPRVKIATTTATASPDSVINTTIPIVPATAVFPSDPGLTMNHQNHNSAPPRHAHVDALLAACAYNPQQPQLILQALVQLNQQIFQPTAEHEQNRVAIAAAGGIAAIVSIMEAHPHDAALLQVACGALWNLACNETNQKAMGQQQPPQAIAAIVTAMHTHPHHDELQRYACGALWSLACNNKHNQKVIGQTTVVAPAAGGSGSAIAAILTAMQRHPHHVELQTSACAALWSLACHGNNQQSIGQAPGGLGVAVLLAAMKHHVYNATVQRNACGALQKLAWRHELNQTTIGQAPGGMGIVAILTAMATHPADAELQNCACGALENLTHDHYYNQVSIGAAPNGIASILTAMRTHPDHAELQQSACAALGNLACTSDNRAAIGRSSAGGGCIAAILTAMKTFPGYAELQQAACTALGKLAANENNVAEIFKSGGIALLEQALRLHPDDTVVQEQARQALRLIQGW